MHFASAVIGYCFVIQNDHFNLATQFYHQIIKLIFKKKKKKHDSTF